MKTKLHQLALLGLMLLAFEGLSAQSILLTESFETDGEGVRYTSNTFNFCSGSPGANPDYFLRTNINNPVLPPGTCTAGFGTSITPEGVALCGTCGTFFWASEDIRSSSPVINGNPPGNITFFPINVASYTNLQVSLFLVTASNNNVRWEDSDSINIQTTRTGNAKKTVGRFMGNAPAGGRLIIDANLNGAYDSGTEASPACDIATMTKYTFTVPNQSGNNLTVTLDFDQLGGTEEIAIDMIQVTGNLVVPVKWASFTAHQVDETVKLDWATTEETSVASFEVERLSGSGTYVPIGTVGAKGEASSYGFVDYSAAIGSNLYRIRQVDQDNTYTYSDAVEVNFAPTFRAALYPNPMNDGCRLAIEGETITGAMHIVDNMGRIHRTETFEGASELLIPRNGLSQGIYYLRLDLINGRTFTKKLMVHD